MKKVVFISLWFLLFTLSGIANGQDDASLSILDIRSAPNGNVQMIVSVLDEQGRAIKGLSNANFKISVDGKELKEISLEPVSSAQTPLSIILGIDVSGSMNGKPITEVKKAASIFIDQLDRKDFSALMVFGSSVRFLSDFNQSKHEVREKIENMIANEKWTWLYQATYDGLDKASKAPTSRVAIVLLTDGKDEGSPTKEEDVIDKIRGTRIPIYTLGFGANAQIDYLKRIASTSGGYFLFTPKAEELSNLYNVVLDQLKNQYLVQFNFQNPVGDYTSTLTLNYHGREITIQRTFLHSIIESPKQTSKDLIKNPVIWGIITLTIIILGLALTYFIKKPKSPTGPSIEEKEKPKVSLMTNKKIHPLGLSLGNLDLSTTIAQPLPSRGEVGFEIDIQPFPLTFALIDEKHKKYIDEVIITRYDSKNDHIFSKDKVYLLLADSTISRPDEEREGHARIFKDIETGMFKIEDLGSTAGTKVKDNILSKRTAISLVNGDTIIVGNVSLKYYDKRPLTETIG